MELGYKFIWFVSNANALVQFIGDRMAILLPLTKALAVFVSSVCGKNAHTVIYFLDTDNIETQTRRLKIYHT